jgi:hypothetical protein
MVVLEDLVAVRATELVRAGWVRPSATNDFITGAFIATVSAVEDELCVNALTASGPPTAFRLAVHRLPEPWGKIRVLLGCPACDRRVGSLYWHRDNLSCRHCPGLLKYMLKFARAVAS